MRWQQRNNNKPTNMAAKAGLRILAPLLNTSRTFKTTLLFPSQRNTDLLKRFYSSTVSSILSSPLPEFEGRPDILSHQDLYKFSLEKSDVFWGTLASSRLEWMKDYDVVQDCNLSDGKISWFLGGKLNVSGEYAVGNNAFTDLLCSRIYVLGPWRPVEGSKTKSEKCCFPVNCVDRHFKKTPDKVALIWEKDEPGQAERVTYRFVNISLTLPQEEHRHDCNILKSVSFQGTLLHDEQNCQRPEISRRQESRQGRHLHASFTTRSGHDVGLRQNRRASFRRVRWFQRRSSGEQASRRYSSFFDAI